ncbi:hypothetical protein E2C01_092799 [Portunus trituberculatus]|uniref:Uncharacterized protein n=1 Tax=Portunus trituberculatus TaxID=210409 RepID=A0A5B7JHD5_PORTR|nr:hypothetical protein [Portunus trituberculatus]
MCEVADCCAGEVGKGWGMQGGVRHSLPGGFKDRAELASERRMPPCSGKMCWPEERSLGRETRQASTGGGKVG